MYNINDHLLFLFVRKGKNNKKTQISYERIFHDYYNDIALDEISTAENYETEKYLAFALLDYGMNILKGNIDYDNITSFIETNQHYLIICSENKGIMVYNYPDLTEYYRFIENNDSNFHNYAKIIKVDDIYNLIDVGDFNKIKLWNFYNKTLIANISTNNSSGFAGFITINNRYLIIGSFDGSIKEFDIHERILIKSFNNQHSNKILGIKIIKDKNGKNNLVSYGKDKNILLWSID